MLDKRTLLRMMGAAAAAIMIASAAWSASADILDQWDEVKPPPRPELKPVTLQGSMTALLILDMTKTGNCSMRPRCIATVPAIKRLEDAARNAGAMLWYSNVTPTQIIDLSIAPHEGEYARTNGPDKFYGTDLDDKLKARGVKTVIVCGTSFQGVGIGTASASAQRGYNIVVPIDCLSSEDLYMEQYAAWHLFKGGPTQVTKLVTLTRSSMVKFTN